MPATAPVVNCDSGATRPLGDGDQEPHTAHTAQRPRPDGPAPDSLEDRAELTGLPVDLISLLDAAAAQPAPAVEWDDGVEQLADHLRMSNLNWRSAPKFLSYKTVQLFQRAGCIDEGPAAPPVDEQRETCGVCLETVIVPTTPDGCSHVFCLGCIHPWAVDRGRPSCPTCRSPITGLRVANSGVSISVPRAEVETDDVTEITAEEFEAELAPFRLLRRQTRQAPDAEMDEAAVAPAAAAPVADAAAPAAAAPAAAAPAATPVPTSVEQLRWCFDGLLEADAVEVPQASLSSVLFSAIADAGAIYAFSAAEWRQRCDVLESTIASARRAQSLADAREPTPWHDTLWTADYLSRNGCQRVSGHWIQCVHHPAAAEVPECWELMALCAPSGTAAMPEMEAAASAFAAAATSRFVVSDDAESGLPICRRRGPANLYGEQRIAERGKKVRALPHLLPQVVLSHLPVFPLPQAMEGNLLQIGCHRRYAAGAAEHVNGCAKEWPDRYGPSGDRDGDDAQNAIAALSSHALALGALEAAIAPEAAAARAAVAERLDPEAKFRIVEGDNSCAAFSMALYASYCVEAHNDSGRALEMIAFQYGSETPMPAGHEWLFAVGGLIQQLPTSPTETVFMAVKGEGCAHGTLPTSSSRPHLARHPGFSTTLVTKQDLCRVLSKGEQEGEMWPTHEQLAARRAELAAEKEATNSTDDGVAAGTKALLEARAQQETATEAVEKAMAACKEAISSANPAYAGVQAAKELVEHLESEQSEAHLDAIVAANTAALASSPPEQAEDASLPEPNTLAALKHAIAKEDFGVVAGDDGGNPAPPLAAIRAYKAAGGTVELDRNAQLPLCFYILQVRPLSPKRGRSTCHDSHGIC